MQFHRKFSLFAANGVPAMVDVISPDGFAVQIPSKYANVTLPKSPYPTRKPSLNSFPRRNAPIEEIPEHLQKQNPNTMKAFPINVKRYINVARLQEAFRWDSDNRFVLFNPLNPECLPIGSIVKAYYYPYPLPVGVNLPLRKTLSAEEIQKLKWEKLADGKNRYLVDVHQSQKTQSNMIPEGTTIYIPPSMRGAKSLLAEKPPKAPYFTVNPGLQPLSFCGALIASEGIGSGRTITLRNVIDGVGSDMIFHLFSPLLVALQVKKRAPPSDRKDLYYLRQVDPQHSLYKEPPQEPLLVRINGKGEVEANVPYVYLSPPIQIQEDKRKK